MCCISKLRVFMPSYASFRYVFTAHISSIVPGWAVCCVPPDLIIQHCASLSTDTTDSCFSLPSSKLSRFSTIILRSMMHHFLTFCMSDVYYRQYGRGICDIFDKRLQTLVQYLLGGSIAPFIVFLLNISWIHHTV